MVNKAADRRARVEQLRAQQAREERKGRAIVIGAVTVVLAVLVAAVAWGVNQSPRAGSQASAGAASIAGLRTFTGLSRDHVNGPVSYPQTPPVGGPHAAVWENCGWYDVSVPSENAVHSLEHAAVWVTYRPDLSSADRSALKSELAGRPYVVASAFPGLPGPVVASAWGNQVVLDGVRDPRLMTFVAAFANSPKAPEPGGECTGGTGTPS